MELHELIATFGGMAALLGLQSFWIGRALNDLRDGVRELRIDVREDVRDVREDVRDVRAELREFRAENHADMATHTSAIADLRDRVVRLES